MTRYIANIGPRALIKSLSRFNAADRGPKQEVRDFDAPRWTDADIPADCLLAYSEATFLSGCALCMDSVLRKR